jgi:hypothetical protein
MFFTDVLFLLVILQSHIKLCFSSTTTNTYSTVTATQQSFTVPANCFSMTIDMSGARGNSYYGNAVGGNGARVQATFDVVPNTLYYYNIGGAGTDYLYEGNPGGYNGGGASGANSGLPGGGATDLRISPGINLDTRIMVAGGGGGASYGCSKNGGSSDQNGADGLVSGSTGGYGGTQTAAGQAGCQTPGTNCGEPGNQNMGGKGGGGGGGGGYFGGMYHFYQFPPCLSKIQLLTFFLSSQAEEDIVPAVQVQVTSTLLE